MAFEGDLDRWLHPSVWHVAAEDHALPEGNLIGGIERQLAPARITAVQMSPRRDLAQMMQATDGATVLVNPYTGAILAHRHGPTRTQEVLGYIHQIHLRLAMHPRSAFGPAGKAIVSSAGLLLCLLAPTGLLLWWRAKRLAIRAGGSWFRLCFDTHNVIGFYAGFFLWIAAFTGVLIGFDFAERAIYSLTNSFPPSRTRPQQPIPATAAKAIGVDQALQVARNAMPAASVDGFRLPLTSKDSFVIVMRVPEETSGSAHSDVTVDRYTGRILQVHNFLTDSSGYRWIRFNRSIHTGDIAGLPGHIVVSLSSLLLVVMVATGVVIWWKKLAQ